MLEGCGFPLVSLLPCAFFVDLGVWFPGASLFVVVVLLALGWPLNTLPPLVAGCVCVCVPSQKK